MKMGFGPLCKLDLRAKSPFRSSSFLHLIVLHGSRLKAQGSRLLPFYASFHNTFLLTTILFLLPLLQVPSTPFFLIHNFFLFSFILKLKGKKKKEALFCWLGERTRKKVIDRYEYHHQYGYMNEFWMVVVIIHSFKEEERRG